jgi:hypothetical protein
MERERNKTRAPEAETSPQPPWARESRTGYLAQPAKEHERGPNPRQWPHSAHPPQALPKSETWAWRASSSACALPSPGAESAAASLMAIRPIPRILHPPLACWPSKMHFGMAPTAAGIRIGRTTSANQFRELSRHFTHQRQQIFLRVPEKGHPQIISRHFRDHVRLVLAEHSACL